MKRMWLGEARAIPRLVVLGAQKGGTTAIYTYLSKHPLILPTTTKELNYFNQQNGETISLIDYLSLFPCGIGRSKKYYSLDASPNYSIDLERCLTYSQSIELDLRYLFVLREPIDRAISAWFMYKSYHKDQAGWFMREKWVQESKQRGLKIIRRSPNFGESFAHDIKEELSALSQGARIEYPIVEYGQYKQQLSIAKKLIPSDRLMLIESSDLKNKTQECLDQVLDFLSIPRHQFSKQELRPEFVGKNKHTILKEELEPLKKYYEVENRGLKDLVERPSSWMV